MSEAQVENRPKEAARLRIRLAEPGENVDALIPLLRKALSESRYASLSLSEDRVKALLAAHLEEPKLIGIILAEHLSEAGATHPVGILYAMAGRLPFAEATSCAAHLFYVRPEARRSRAAHGLLKAFEKLAKNRQAFEAAVHVTMGRTEDARVSKLLSRYGFENTGGRSHFKNF